MMYLKFLQSCNERNKAKVDPLLIICLLSWHTYIDKEKRKLAQKGISVKVFGTVNHLVIELPVRYNH